jgi:hypothetical protein
MDSAGIEGVSIEEHNPEIAGSDAVTLASGTHLGVPDAASGQAERRDQVG